MENNSIEYKGAAFQPIEEVRKTYGFSRYYFKQKLKAGTLPHIRCGNRIFVNVPRFLAELENETDNSLVKL